MILAFDPKSLPRSTTRGEWRKIDRWRRQTVKRLAAATGREIDSLVTFGTTHPELARRLADRLVSPPLLIWDGTVPPASIPDDPA